MTIPELVAVVFSIRCRFVARDGRLHVAQPRGGLGRMELAILEAVLPELQARSPEIRTYFELPGGGEVPL